MKLYENGNGNYRGASELPAAGNELAIRAYRLLNHRISRIRTVSEWADTVGCSRGWLSKIIREEYGREPRVLIREVRKVRILKAILENPCATSYCIAVDVGLKDEKAMYRFLKYNYRTTFTDLRHELLQHRDVNGQSFLNNEQIG